MVWENDSSTSAQQKKGIVFYQKCYKTGTVMDFSFFCPFIEAVTQASELKESCNTLEVIGMGTGRCQGGGSGFRGQGASGFRGRWR